MRKIISAIMACVLVSGITFNVHAADFRSSLQKVKAVSYDSSQLAEYAEQVAVLVNKERIAYECSQSRFLRYSVKLQTSEQVK